jgi:uncharacterized membrane protein
MTWIDKIFELQFIFGFIFLILGLLMLKFPPKSINAIYGYRTTNSMSNIEKWHYSQKYSAILMCKLAIFQIFSSFFGIFFKYSTSLHDAVGFTSVILNCVILIIMTERKLNSEFPKIRNS